MSEPRKINIVPAHPADYPEIVEVWEASVRATHHFLAEEHIQMFKPLILNEYLKAVRLWCVRNESGRIQGFLGTSPDAIEMLFLHPDVFGTGLGKQLTMFAIRELKATKVDVNEQNIHAIGFYSRVGFKAIGRSEKDGMGLPYPIIHMAL